jgi:hypothetical protein
LALQPVARALGSHACVQNRFALEVSLSERQVAPEPPHAAASVLADALSVHAAVQMPPGMLVWQVSPPQSALLVHGRPAYETLEASGPASAVRASGVGFVSGMRAASLAEPSP